MSSAHSQSGPEMTSLRCDHVDVALTDLRHQLVQLLTTERTQVGGTPDTVEGLCHAGSSWGKAGREA